MQAIELAPCWGQSLAVATPWGKEFDEPGQIRSQLGTTLGIQVHHKLVKDRRVDLRWLPLSGVWVLDDGLLGEDERVRGKKEQRGCHGEDFHRVPIRLLEIKIIFPEL